MARKPLRAAHLDEQNSNETGPIEASVPAISAGRLETLLTEIRACAICRDTPHRAPLPHAPRPVLRAKASARVAICGQAPGVRVHASGVPFTDPSGVRLRGWLGMDESEFYDESRVAIVPMGFCFPGLTADGADRPPRAECAPTWRKRVFVHLPKIELVFAVGRPAQLWHLGEEAGDSMTDAVANWRRALSRAETPTVAPLPHPSWRNNAWLKRNPWFENEALPVYRALARSALNGRLSYSWNESAGNSAPPRDSRRSSIEC